ADTRVVFVRRTVLEGLVDRTRVQSDETAGQAAIARCDVSARAGHARRTAMAVLGQLAAFDQAQVLADQTAHGHLLARAVGRTFGAVLDACEIRDVSAGLRILDQGADIVEADEAPKHDVGAGAADVA